MKRNINNTIIPIYSQFPRVISNDVGLWWQTTNNYKLIKHDWLSSQQQQNIVKSTADAIIA